MIFSLKAAGIGPGDEVITVAHTFVASIGVIVHVGATPILIDVGDDYCMDMDLLEAAITSRTKAILPVQFNGRACDMERCLQIARRHGLVVIEDAAQALGATFRGRRAGSFGLTGCFSFYPAKMLGAAADGGIACTDDDEIAFKIRMMTDHGRKTKDEIVLYGYTSLLDNIQAAILNVKFPRFPAWVERRREIARRYDAGLAGLPGLRIPPRPDADHGDVYQNYVIRSDRRDELAAHLRANGVELIISNPIPVNHQPALGLSHFRLPKTEQLAGEVMSLPMYPELEDEQVDYVLDQIRAFTDARSVGAELAAASG
jgi:dTDP-4-amino-4,6-dideoxygalactose transaminase